jgi:hypothetical protein
MTIDAKGLAARPAFAGLGRRGRPRKNPPPVPGPGRRHVRAVERVIVGLAAERDALQRQIDYWLDWWEPPGVGGRHVLPAWFWPEQAPRPLP